MDEASLRELASLIRAYFRHNEGRGNNCVVAPFRRGELDYFFAYPEDYSQQSIEWVDGQFGRWPHNPAFEVIYVYSQKEGSLDLNFRGSHKAIEPLQGMFATAVLKLPELPPDPKDGRVYDLNPLRQKSFNFVFDVSSGIQDAAIKKLRLSSKVKKGDRITLEADAVGKSRCGLRLAREDRQVRAAAPVQRYPGGACGVGYGGRRQAAEVGDDPHHSSQLLFAQVRRVDLKLRDMLEASGIEPKEPAEGAEATEAAEAAEA